MRTYSRISIYHSNSTDAAQLACMASIYSLSVAPPPAARAASVPATRTRGALAMASESLASAVRSMAPLLAGSIGPLAVTSGRHHPAVVALATALSLLLGRMTFNLGSIPTKFNVQREQVAMRLLLTTSTANRVTRMLLGACYFYAAVSFSRRAATYAAQQKDGRHGRFSTMVWQVGSWIALPLLLFIGGTWCSSGFYGQ